MTANSLSLLKGDSETVTDEIADNINQVADTGEENVEVDVDGMSSAELDALVSEHEIETPAEWGGWDAEGKREWLKSQFEAQAEPEPEPAPAPAPATVEAKAKDTKKKKGQPAASAEIATDAGAKEAAEIDPAAAPAGPAKKKGKAVDKAPKTGEIVTPGDDPLFELVHEIENIKEQEARALVGKLAEQSEITFFRLGGVLSVIQANSWFSPYASFKDYVEKEHGLHYRKASYWVSIYNGLVESKVPWEKVKHLGWTKLKELVPVLTASNVDEWVAIAEKSNTISLIDAVKASVKKDAPKAIEDQSSTTVTTKTFKIHDDQKATIEAAIAKAKQQSGTTYDTVALEYICSDFLSGQTIEQRLKTMGIEKALAAVEAAFPNAKIEVEIAEE
jgi:hypothetical protein